MTTKNNKPRQYALVKLTDEEIAAHEKSFSKVENNRYIYMGEIPNMPGHCIVAGVVSGKTYTGMHIKSYEEVDADDT